MEKSELKMAVNMYVQPSESCNLCLMSNVNPNAMKASRVEVEESERRAGWTGANFFGSSMADRNRTWHHAMALVGCVKSLVEVV